MKRAVVLVGCLLLMVLYAGEASGQVALRRLSPDAPQARVADALLQRVLAGDSAGAVALLTQHAAPGADLLVDHFLPAGLHVLNEEVRESGAVTAIRTRENVPGPRRLNVPLYLLTSSATASAGEWIPFVLQAQGCALVVGERAAGAGRAVRGVRLGHGLSVGVSVSRTWDPRSGRGFESVGVLPDMETDAADALDAALSHARAATGR